MELEEAAMIRKEKNMEDATMIRLRRCLEPNGYGKIVCKSYEKLCKSKIQKQKNDKKVMKVIYS